MTRITFIIFVSLLQIGYSTYSQPFKTKNKTQLTQLNAKLIDFDTAGIPYYRCEEFISYFVDSINQDFRKNKYASLLTQKFETLVNSYNPNEIDTIITFLNNSNEIKQYRSKDKAFIISLDIQDTRINLYKNLHPGVTYEEFSKIFNITNSNLRKVRIGNYEGLIVITFHFINSKLYRITSDIYRD